MVVHACNPSPGGKETGGMPGAHWPASLPIEKPYFPVRDPDSQKQQEQEQVGAPEEPKVVLFHCNMYILHAYVHM